MPNHPTQRKDIVNDIEDKHSLPEKLAIKNNPPKAKCQDPMHGERELREGEKVYVVFNHTGEVSIESISCLTCSAQAIYEKADKDSILSVGTGVLSTDSVEDTSKDLSVENISVLDTYTPP